MSVKFICDGCGKESEGYIPRAGMHTIKPPSWFERTMSVDKDGRPLDTGFFGTVYHRVNLHACSRECIERAAVKRGGHSLVLPI